MNLPEHDPALAQAPLVLARFKRALNLSLLAVIALSAIFFAQGALGDLRSFALKPHELRGLLGVFTAPLLHGSVGHLAANAVSIVVLGTLAGTVFPKATARALPVVWIGSGLGAWLLAIGGYHLGASGVTHGLGFLIFTLALLRRDRSAIAAALIVFFFFGSMLLTVLPRELDISWEYHLCGALAGTLSGLLWRHADPPPPRVRYSWEDEADENGISDASEASSIEPPRPRQVPVLWRRRQGEHGTILPFRAPTVDPHGRDKPSE